MLVYDLLSRIDNQALQDLIGRAGIDLLSSLDTALVSSSRLKEIVLSLHSSSGLILQKQTRNILLEFLRPADLKNLALVLGLSAEGNFPEVLNELRKLNIGKGSSREQALLDFFEIPQRGQTPVIIPASQENVTSQYMMFAHQRDAAAKVTRKLEKSPWRVLLHMPTGSGKTRTTMNIIAEHLRKKEPSLVIWLAFSEELCEQAAEEFSKSWEILGNRPVDLYRLWGSYEVEINQIGDGLVIAGLSKLYQRVKRDAGYISSLGVKASLVIIDEAHSAIAETYKLVLDALTIHNADTGLLGLSATPGRTWSNIEKDQELADYFAKQKVTLEVEGFANPIEYLIQSGYLARPLFRSLYSDGGIDLSEADVEDIKVALDIPSRILEQLAEDEIRNLRIISEVETLVLKHKRIILFAATVFHSDLLATVLQARGYDAKSITSKTDNSLRKTFIEDFKNSDTDEPKILCNYGVLTTGFDAPNTSCAVIARPTKSLVLYSQMIGRALRGLKAGGNSEAEIVTVVDKELPGFRDISEAFLNWEDVWEGSNDES